MSLFIKSILAILIYIISSKKWAVDLQLLRLAIQSRMAFLNRFVSLKTKTKIRQYPPKVESSYLAKQEPNEKYWSSILSQTVHGKYLTE